jgi:hypothetical protein
MANKVFKQRVGSSPGGQEEEPVAAQEEINQPQNEGEEEPVVAQGEVEEQEEINQPQNEGEAEVQEEEIEEEGAAEGDADPPAAPVQGQEPAAGGGYQYGGSDSDMDSISMLGGDPLFLVLSEFFMTKSGKNIADVLEEISAKLGKKGKKKGKKV